ncbi:MAG: hypothetical protein ACK56F_05590, partial [bacterium]
MTGVIRSTAPSRCYADLVGLANDAARLRAADTTSHLVRLGFRDRLFVVDAIEAKRDRQEVIVEQIVRHFQHSASLRIAEITPGDRVFAARWGLEHGKAGCHRIYCIWCHLHSLARNRCQWPTPGRGDPWASTIGGPAELVRSAIQ